MILISPRLPGMSWIPGAYPLNGIKSAWPFGIWVHHGEKPRVRKCNEPLPTGRMEHGFAVIDSRKILRGNF